MGIPSSCSSLPALGKVFAPIGFSKFSFSKSYGSVAGDRKNLVINIQTKEGNTNLDVLK